MLELPKLIEPLFMSAGWQRSERYPECSASSDPADLAQCIIQEFSGLRVGECSVGTEQAAGDIRFFSAIRAQTCEGAAACRGSAGQLWAFATAHHDHMVLFVGTDRRFYIFTEPDECLYDQGSSFGDLMRKVLWGYKFGLAIPRDA